MEARQRYYVQARQIAMMTGCLPIQHRQQIQQTTTITTNTNTNTNTNTIANNEWRQRATSNGASLLEELPLIRWARISKWITMIAGIMLCLGLMTPVHGQTKGKGGDGKPLKILFLGDSLTEGYGVHPTESYPAQIENLFAEQNQKVEVINAGISGDTSLGGLNRFRWYIKNNTYPGINLIFIALGANDGLRGLPIQTVYKNLDEIIKIAKEQNIQVVLAGMQLPPNYGQEYGLAFYNIYLRLEKAWKIKLMPFLLKDVGGEEALNQDDGIHPTAEGHSIMAKNVYAVIAPIVKRISQL